MKVSISFEGLRRCHGLHTQVSRKHMPAIMNVLQKFMG